MIGTRRRRYEKLPQSLKPASVRWKPRCGNPDRRCTSLTTPPCCGSGKRSSNRSINCVQARHLQEVPSIPIPEGAQPAHIRTIKMETYYLETGRALVCIDLTDIRSAHVPSPGRKRRNLSEPLHGIGASWRSDLQSMEIARVRGENAPYSARAVSQLDSGIATAPRTLDHPWLRQEDPRDDGRLLGLHALHHLGDRHGPRPLAGISAITQAQSEEDRGAGKPIPRPHRAALITNTCHVFAEGSPMLLQMQELAGRAGIDGTRQVTTARAADERVRTAASSRRRPRTGS